MIYTIAHGHRVGLRAAGVGALIAGAGRPGAPAVWVAGDVNAWSRGGVGSIAVAVDTD